jgi:hypothetical protein
MLVRQHVSPKALSHLPEKTMCPNGLWITQLLPQAIPNGDPSTAIHPNATTRQSWLRDVCLPSLNLEIEAAIWSLDRERPAKDIRD